MNRILLLTAIVVVGIALVWGTWSALRPPAEKQPAIALVAQEQKTEREAKPKAPPPAGIPILMYHSIGDEQGNDAVISKERFVEQMTFLSRHGFNPITLDDLYDYLSGQGDLPARPVVLTFDDGYRDTYEVALPILKQYGFKSVMFIPASEAGQRLSWQELNEMKNAGMQIGSHSFTHRDLGVMPAAEQAEEIAKSKELLDRYLTQDTRDFCYPNGSYNGETLRLLKAKGFRLAVTLEAGWVKPGDAPLTLKRVWMGNAVDSRHFEERITKENYSIL